jgi:5-methylcytosine-specific restriction endonuclease McrA
MLDAPTIAAWAAALAGVDRNATDEERIDQIRELEVLKCAAEAAQAVLIADFDSSQRAEQALAGVPARQQGRGVAAQIALARRESPHKGQQHLGLAKILPTELPHTMAAFRAGHITEWRAMLIGRETGCLSLADRRAVDEVLAADPERLAAMGDRELVGEARKLAYRLDPRSFVQRRRRAESDRAVTIRPAPDTMSYLTGLLPVAQGVAVYAALRKAADSARAGGDPRGRGQIMADTLVERVTGQSSAEVVPLRVNLVISDDVLFGADGHGHIEGFGPVPGDLARDLATRSRQRLLRRLYARPATGELVAMESRSRNFPKGLAELIDLRDQTCRTPWCDAPIRHHDHARSVEEDGATSAANGQGLCEACNHAKQAPGWTARPRPGPTHTVETRTPTGHSYRSQAPPVTHPDIYWPLEIAC